AVVPPGLLGAAQREGFEDRDDLGEQVERDGLAHEEGRAQAQALTGLALGRDTRDGDDRYAELAHEAELEEVEAAHARQMDVEDDRVGAFGLELAERGFGAPDHQRVVSEVEEEIAQQVAEVRLVLDHQHSHTTASLARPLLSDDARGSVAVRPPRDILVFWVDPRRRNQLSGYVPVFIFAVLIIAFGVVSLVVARLLRPGRPGVVKLTNYECGAEPIGSAWVQFPVGFYLVAHATDSAAGVERVQGSPGVGEVPSGARDRRQDLQRPRCDRRHDPPHARWLDRDDDDRQDLQLGAKVVDLAGDVRARLLRDRDDGDVRVPVRRRAFRDGPVGVAAPLGPHDRLRNRDDQDGADAQAHLRPDARPEVGGLHGLVRELRRPLPPRLPRREGGRPGRPGRCLRPGMPADARLADVRAAQTAGAGRRIPEDRQASDRLRSPVSMTAADASARIRETFGIEAAVEGATVTVVVPRESWTELATFALRELGAHYFNWLSAIDWKESGLEVVCRLENLDAGLVVTLRTRL